MSKVLRGGLRLLVAVMLVTAFQSYVTDMMAAPGRDFPRCVQQCNEIRKECTARCAEECTTGACNNACRDICDMNSDDCKDVCRAIKDGETPEDP